jgi:hypothetical protein
MEGTEIFHPSTSDFRIEGGFEALAKSLRSFARNAK